MNNKSWQFEHLYPLFTQFYYLKNKKARNFTANQGLNQALISTP
jgi:hypothetical protein